MRVRLALAAAALVAVGVCPALARGEVLEKTGTFSGLRVTYKVVLPAAYDASKTYPLVLVFTGGPQTLQIATSTVEADWRAEAERRGYIVVAPASPNGELFFEGADRIFPSFLDQMLRDYHVGKVHVAGHSNGGLSAFHIAARYPKYFSTVIGYPGLLDGPDAALANAIKDKCVFMHVGDRDSGWMPAMQEEAKDLSTRGFRIRITVEKNQVHRLKAQEIDLSRRLFDEIESCR
jgi:poly(3-hydroxybutyrate) depolymerase